MTYQRESEAVLAMWREIERALEAAEPGSREAERLIADAARLRDEYQRLVQETIDDEHPVPPKLPEMTEAN
jgi:hypothetical protein